MGARVRTAAAGLRHTAPSPTPGNGAAVRLTPGALDCTDHCPARGCCDLVDKGPEEDCKRLGPLHIGGMADALIDVQETPLRREGEVIRQTLCHPHRGVQSATNDQAWEWEAGPMLPQPSLGHGAPPAQRPLPRILDAFAHRGPVRASSLRWWGPASSGPIAPARVRG
jgi:hypothetical protein